MRVTITSQGDHDPAGMHLVMIDDRCMLLDLSAVDGTLHDASITKLDWSQLQDGRTVRDGGFITRADGSKTPIFDKQAVLPYVTLFETEWASRHDIHEASIAEAQAADEAQSAAEAVAAAKGQAELKATEEALVTAEAQAHADVIASVAAAEAQAVANKLARDQAEAEAIAAIAAAAKVSREAAIDAAFAAQQAANAAAAAAGVLAAGSPSPTGNPNV